MRVRHPITLLLFALSIALAALAVSAGVATTKAGATPGFTTCAGCHSKSTIHAVGGHSDALQSCTPCHVNGTSSSPTPAACASCHGASSILAKSSHSTCATTPGCHSAPAPSAAITGITPAGALSGANVTIAGNGFGGATGSVAFGATAATVVSWSDTSIVATVPAVSPGTVQVKVTPDGGSATAGFSFTVEAPQAGDTTAPDTTAAGAVNNRWYNRSLTIALTAADEVGGSGVASITSAVDGGENVVENAATAQIVLTVDKAGHTTDGAHGFTFFATDVAGNVEDVNTLSVHIDTRKPTTRALKSVVVKRNRTTALRYRVNETGEFAGTATVTLKIKNAKGKVVKTLKLGKKAVNKSLSKSWRATLKRGTYRYFVYAKDAAGNTQVKATSAKIRIVR
jgi:hypothetical protein